LGQALVLEPFLSTVVLGAGCIELAGRPEQRAALLPDVAQGKLLLALAHAEQQSRYDLTNVQCSAVSEGDGWTLRGEKFLVLGAPSAHRLIVSARMPDGQMALFLVEPQAPGVQLIPYVTQDGHQAANVRLTDVRVA